MTEYRNVFLDTTPLIYFLDEDVNFGFKVRRIFEEILESGKQMLTFRVLQWRNGSLWTKSIKNNEKTN